MKKTLLISFFICNLLGCSQSNTPANAQSLRSPAQEQKSGTCESQALSSPGFNSADNCALPSEVRFAALKTYEIWASSAEGEWVYPPFDAVQETVGKRPTNNFRQQMLKKINLAELQICKKLNASKCALTKSPGFDFIPRGTAFVANGKIITAGHNVDGALKWLVNLSSFGLEKTSPDLPKKALNNIVIFLTDHSEQIVFSSVDANDSVLVTPKLDYAVDKVNYWYESGSSVGSDVAVIQTTKKLETLSIANQSECAFGTESFLAGYPSGSNDRAQYGLRDAVDRQLQVSNGVFLSKKAAIENSGRDSSAVGFIENAYTDKNYQTLKREEDSKIFFTSSDSEPGLSGAPILNSKGQVCGLFSWGFPQIGLNYDSNSHAFFKWTAGLKVEAALEKGTH